MAGKRNVPSPARVLMMESVPLCGHKTTVKIGEKITKTSEKKIEEYPNTMDYIECPESSEPQQQ